MIYLMDKLYKMECDIILMQPFKVTISHNGDLFDFSDDELSHIQIIDRLQEVCLDIRDIIKTAIGKGHEVTIIIETKPTN